MSSLLLTQVRKMQSLQKAWRTVRRNGITSKSETVKKEIQKFDEDPDKNLRSLQSRLGHNSFKFLPARGVPIKKPNKKDIRPLVIAHVETRIVQRSILDALQGIEALRPYFRNPYSFGGIKRGEDDDLAAVPAAISAVLDAIAAGGSYVACADISAFFTRISKSAVADIVAGVVDDNAFMALFRQAIHVELENLAALRKHAGRFPTEDIGVAQGSALSPLLGNIILADFDRRMNEGECRCLRYIDDFIILGSSSAAVMGKLRLGKKVLGDLGMALSPGKTSQQAIPISKSFEFLGIEMGNGLIRPAGRARVKFLSSVQNAFKDSRQALVGYRNGQPLAKSSALLGTLKRVDGIIQGWGKHYRFCNDNQCFRNLDAELGKLIGDYLGFYSDERQSAGSARAPALLGVEMLGAQERTPFAWPKVAGKGA